jgi:hypothetical protein
MDPGAAWPPPRHGIFRKAVDNRYRVVDAVQMFHKRKTAARACRELNAQAPPGAPLYVVHTMSEIACRIISGSRSVGTSSPPTATGR